MTGPANMRAAMPQTAAFIDAMREAFGADAVDPSIRAGMRGEPFGFYAEEAGHQVGTPMRFKLEVTALPAPEFTRKDR